MKFTKFPGSEQLVSRIGFGTMGLGGSFGTFDESYLIKSVLHSLERGVTLIDTARAYGASEKLVGLTLKQWRGRNHLLLQKCSRWVRAPLVGETTSLWRRLTRRARCAVRLNYHLSSLGSRRLT